MSQQTLPIEIESPDAWQGAAPDQKTEPEYYAGVALRRVLAYLVDVVLIAVLMGIAWVLFAALSVLSLGLLSPALWPLFAVIPLAYHVLLIGGESSATYGMRLFKIEVRAWDGRRPDYLRAALMTIVFYTTVALTSWLILLVALLDQRRRTLHDHLCGTLVINTLHWRPAGAPGS